MYIGNVCRLAKPRTIEQVRKQQEDHVPDEDNWERILVANLLFALLASIWGVGGAVYLARAVKKSYHSDKQARLRVKVLGGYNVMEGHWAVSIARETSGPSRARVSALACIWLGELLGKWSCWRCCLLAFLYSTNTMHSVHGLGEWISCVCRVLLLTCYCTLQSLSYNTVLSSQCCHLVLYCACTHTHSTGLRFPQSQLHQNAVQFIVFQNHLNPHLLLDMWMVDYDMMNLPHSSTIREYLCIKQQKISHLWLLRGDLDSRTED